MAQIFLQKQLKFTIQVNTFANEMSIGKLRFCYVIILWLAH